MYDGGGNTERRRNLFEELRVDLGQQRLCSEALQQLEQPRRHLPICGGPFVVLLDDLDVPCRPMRIGTQPVASIATGFWRL